jgi:hypothetical protein
VPTVRGSRPGRCRRRGGPARRWPRTGRGRGPAARSRRPGSCPPGADRDRLLNGPGRSLASRPGPSGHGQEHGGQRRHGRNHGQATHGHLRIRPPVRMLGADHFKPTQEHKISLDQTFWRRLVCTRIQAPGERRREGRKWAVAPAAAHRDTRAGRSAIHLPEHWAGTPLPATTSQMAGPLPDCGFQTWTSMSSPLATTQAPCP